MPKHNMKTTRPKKFPLSASLVFLSNIINIKKHNKKYTAAYFARKHNPKKTPNKRKFNTELFFLISNSLVKHNTQNNNKNKSVEIKKDERLAAGITKKLIEHKKDSFFEKESPKHSL